MKRSTTEQTSPYLSPIIVNDGLIRGCASVPGENSAQVDVLIDGKPHATIASDLPIAKAYRDAFHCATSDARGFVLPLPAEASDGFRHEIVVRLRHLATSRSDKHGNSSPLESRLSYRHGHCHGHVTAIDQYFQGVVAFDKRSDPLPILTLSDEHGETWKQLTLIPLPNESVDPDHFVATFRISQLGLPIPLRFHCGEIELEGSPCQPKPRRVGLLEKFDPGLIHGWAFDMTRPKSPVELALRIDGQITQLFRPNIRRSDIAKFLSLPVENLGIVGFELAPPECLFDGQAHRISVEFAGLGEALQGSGQQICLPKPALSLAEFALAPRRVNPAKALKRPGSPCVSVIILNRDGERQLDALLESWEKKNSISDAEIIVVDHASEDGSLGLLKRWQTRLPVHVMPLSFNDSFSASCNRAAAEARGQYLLFINNDIVWLQDALPMLLHTLQSAQDVGAVGLKLLRSTDDGQIRSHAQVQHLGVRIKLSRSAYWPYEATPDAVEAEYSPQHVPAVTAAVMLCRKEDFLSAGQFDSAYFYGFEDVEFCLRLGNRLNKKIVCRNDLIALHRHGHTRLSGRAPDVFDRQLNNADTLQSQAGLWLKRRYWASLLSADQCLTVDRLTIAFVVDEVSARTGTSRLRSAATRQARQIIQLFPHARIVFLTPHMGWYNVRNIHILVVGHPEYDIRRVTFRRADLITLAWVGEDARFWVRTPCWQEFDGYLAGSAAVKKAIAQTVSQPIAASSASFPLGPFLDLQSPPLRVAVSSPDHLHPQHQAAVKTLQACLRESGAIVWLEPLDTPRVSSRVADVRVHFLPGKKLPRSNIKSEPHTLNILWAPQVNLEEQTKQLAGWKILSEMPNADWLQQALEDTLGNTFRSS